VTKTGLDYIMAVIGTNRKIRFASIKKAFLFYKERLSK
jgi:hypothetical protein